MTTTYTHVGTHAEDLANGRTVAPGEFVALTDEDLDQAHNMRLIEEGILLEHAAPAGEPATETKVEAPKPTAKPKTTKDGDGK